MLGVLLQSLLQLPAVLADFYLSGLLEEGKVVPGLESDDDELRSFPQVQVRVPPCCQPIVRSFQARAEAKTPPSFTATPLLTWRNSVRACECVRVYERCYFITSLIVPCAITSYARRRRRKATKQQGVGTITAAPVAYFVMRWTKT